MHSFFAQKTALEEITASKIEFFVELTVMELKFHSSERTTRSAGGLRRPVKLRLHEADARPHPERDSSVDQRSRLSADLLDHRNGRYW